MLGPGGVIAQRLPGYELREAQLAMAELVERALAAGRHAVIEAGTGTGKSLGYLVPGILAGKKLLVSTAFKSLQAQLIDKDLPFLQRVLPVPFSAVQLKGRSNYLCLNRVAAQRERLQAGLPAQEALFRTQDAARLWPRLLAWARQTASGDLDEAPFPVPTDLKELVTVDGDGCLGMKCPQRGQCFAELQRARAENAQVVVVNHALLVRDLGLRQATGGEKTVLPDMPALVLDEAQHLEEVATDALGATVSLARWQRLARQLLGLTLRHPAVVAASELSEEQERSRQWQQRADAVERRLAELLERLRPPSERPALRGPTVRLGDGRATAEPVQEALRAFVDDLQAGAPHWLTEEQREGWERLTTQVDDLARDLALVVTPGDADVLVRYLELVGRDSRTQVTLNARPIDVSGALRECLFSAFSSVISTSATLATGDGFGYWRGRVGLERAEELRLDSPFDFARNALVYLPADGAALDPSRLRGAGASDYLDHLADEIEALLRASDGRAFCLFTSTRALEQVHRRLAPRLPWRVLKQGDAARPELLRQFKAEQAVLFGLKSFWEGVDVQGEALSLVAIDKLPFPPPDDPVWSARCDAVNRARGSDWAWFTELALPYASLQLKQGFGRLIRTRSDRGVVALLDGRLVTRDYGARILAALPPARRTRSLDEVRAFFGAD